MESLAPTPPPRTNAESLINFPNERGLHMANRYNQLRNDLAYALLLSSL